MSKYKLYTCLVLSERELGVDKNPQFRQLDTDQKTEGVIVAFEGNNSEEIKRKVENALSELLGNIPGAPVSKPAPVPSPAPVSVRPPAPVVQK